MTHHYPTDSDYYPTERELLEGAAEIIAGQDHLGKRSFQDGDGMFCLIGALLEALRHNLGDHRRATYYSNTALAGDRTYMAARERARLVLERETKYDELAVFNDLDSTTTEDVVLILKKAAAEAGPADG